MLDLFTIANDGCMVVLIHTTTLSRALTTYRYNCRLIVYRLMKIKPFEDTHYGHLKSKHHCWFRARLNESHN